MSLHSPAPGSHFGRYVIDERIGMGGMGVVFRATDTHLNRTVALKVMAGRLAGSDEFTQRFEREADVMARLDSPHVITIHDHGVEAGVPWISTQFVRGGDLGDLLAEEGGLGLARAARVCAQIAEALQDAHDAGVVHRDVKPSNVLLRDDEFLRGGDEPFVYLCDFGIAHTGTTGLTQTGGVAGSWAWLAPERTQGDPGTERSDVYALGCVLWATLTGHAPYDGSDVEVALAQVQQPVPQFAGDRATRRVNAVLARALAKDPADRYASARDFRADLLALTSYGDRVMTAPNRAATTGTGTGTQVRASGAGPVPSRTRRRWVPVAAGVALVLAGSTAYAAWRFAGDDPADPPEPTVVGDVDGDDRGDLLLRWFNYGEDYKEGRNFLIRSTGEGFAAPERLVQPEGLSVRGDVDGDGRDDVLGIDENSESEGLVVTTIGADGDERRQEFPARGHRADAYPVLADVDGDGRDDLVLTVPTDPSASRARLELEVALSAGDRFAEPVTWGDVANWAGYGEVIAPGDVDGDGRDDLVLRRTPPRQAGAEPSTPQFRVMLSEGDAFGPAGPGRDTVGTGPVPAPYDVADVDGDGTDEIVTYLHGSPGTLLVHRFADEVVSEAEEWAVDPVTDPDDMVDMTLVDVDGDGAADAVLQRALADDAVRFDVALSTTTGFEAPARWAEAPCLNQGCDEVWSMLAGNIV